MSIISRFLLGLHYFSRVGWILGSLYNWIFNLRSEKKPKKKNKLHAGPTSISTKKMTWQPNPTKPKELKVKEGISYKLLITYFPQQRPPHIFVVPLSPLSRWSDLERENKGDQGDIIFPFPLSTNLELGTHLTRVKRPIANWDPIGIYMALESWSC